MNKPSGEPKEERVYPHGWWILPTILLEIACAGVAFLVWLLR